MNVNICNFERDYWRVERWNYLAWVRWINFIKASSLFRFRVFVYQVLILLILRRKFNHAKLARSTFMLSLPLSLALSFSISGEVMHHIIDLLIFIFCSRCLLAVSIRAKQQFNKMKTEPIFIEKQNCKRVWLIHLNPPLLWLFVCSFGGIEIPPKKRFQSKFRLFGDLRESFNCLFAFFSLLHWHAKKLLHSVLCSNYFDRN